MGNKIFYGRGRNSEIYLELWNHFNERGMSTGGFDGFGVYDSHEERIGHLKALGNDARFLTIVDGNLCSVGLRYAVSRALGRIMAATIEHVGEEPPEEILREFTNRGFKKSNEVWTL